jgi:ABC-type uncharacterized transport system permease subunit
VSLIAHGFASALYLFTAFLGFTGRGLGLGPKRVPALLVLASALHAVGFYGLHLEHPPVPLSSFPAALSLIGWISALAWLLGRNVLRLKGAGPWVAAIAAAFTVPAMLGLELSQPQVDPADAAVAWSHAHVLLGTAGFSLLALASLSGFGYLAKERGLKRRSRWHQGLPALESLDHAEHVTLALGFVLLTLGVATGFAWGVSQKLDPWNRHTIFLLAAWSVYLVPVGARTIRQQRGAWPARGVVVGFAFLICAYLGIHLLGAAA